MSASVDTYRLLVPGHGAVPSATVSTWLALAAAQHTASAWGDVYDTAMIWWAAAQLEPQVQAGAFSGDCAAPVDPAQIQDPEATSYWTRYLQLRGSRAASAPRLVRSC